MPVLHLVGDIEAMETDPQPREIGPSKGAEHIHDLLLCRMDRCAAGQQPSGVQDIGFLAESGIDLAGHPSRR